MSRRNRNRNRGQKSFIMLPREMLRSREWKELSPPAKIVYICLKGKYNGRNNRDICLYYSELTGIKGLSSSSTISKAFRELEDKEWIIRRNIGGLFRKSNRYELTGRYGDYL